MSNGRVRNSSLLNLADHGVKFVAMFLITPVMARELGDHLYGVWLLVMAFFAYYTFLDMGMGLAGVRYIARELGRSTGEGRLADIVATCQGIFRKIAWVSLGLTTLGAFGAGLLMESSPTKFQVMWVIAVYGGGLVVRFWLMIWPVLLKSYVSYGPIVASSIGRTLVQTGLSLWCLYEGWGIVSLAIVIGCCDIGQQLLIAFAAKRLGVTGGTSRRSLQRELFAYSMQSFATRLAINLKDRIDPFIVAAVVGTVAVPQLAVGCRFLGIARDVVNALFGGQFLAAFSKTEASAGREQMSEDFIRALRLSAVVTAFLGVGMGMFGPVFIERWMGPGFSASADVLMVLLVPYSLFLMQYPAFAMLYSVNRHRSVGRVAWAGSGVNVILSVLFGLKFGLMGVVWATVVDLGVIYGLFFPRLASRSVGMKLSHYYGILLKGAGMVLVPSALYWVTMRAWLRPDYLTIVFMASGLMAVIALVLWLSGFFKRA